MTREAFVEALAELNSFNLVEENNRFMIARHAVHVEAVKAKYPKFKMPESGSPKYWTALNKKDPDLVEELRQADEEAAERVYDEFKARKDAVALKLARLADELIPQSGSDWTLVHTVYESSFASQGWGANRYARGSAMDRAFHYQHCGLEAKVEPKDKSYGVYVKAPELECKIAECKAGPTLVEWVAMCWKNGLNPRVYNPFLPPGFEERNKIDYLGHIGSGG